MAPSNFLMHVVLINFFVSLKPLEKLNYRLDAKENMIKKQFLPCA